MTAPAANFELNCRSQVLHYRDGEINPPFLRKSWKLVPQTNFNRNTQICKISLITTVWFFFFGNKRLLNVTNIPNYCDIQILSSREDHLEMT
ncbi:unnamed protein product [Onchocerca flexuosa]|uniref:Uncharacterized protein n=1 Tax=Onchocerca flexuosa TaxID=387005 RepID=A0A183HX96_9BILA|nr:unnamed protein product [Onchocerca flexuosa]